MGLVCVGGKCAGCTKDEVSNSAVLVNIDHVLEPCNICIFQQCDKGQICVKGKPIIKGKRS
jgi:hypothetical protein